MNIFSVATDMESYPSQ